MRAWSERRYPRGHWRVERWPGPRDPGPAGNPLQPGIGSWFRFHRYLPGRQTCGCDGRARSSECPRASSGRSRAWSARGGARIGRARETKRFERRFAFTHRRWGRLIRVSARKPRGLAPGARGQRGREGCIWGPSVARSALWPPFWGGTAGLTRVRLSASSQDFLRFAEFHPDGVRSEGAGGRFRADASFFVQIAARFGDSACRTRIPDAVDVWWSQQAARISYGDASHAPKTSGSRHPRLSPRSLEG